MTMRAVCFLLIGCTIYFESCSVIEQSSRHDFASGYYKLRSGQGGAAEVYLDITNDSVAVYPKKGDQVEDAILMNISLSASDSLCRYPVTFGKSSLDIDMTTILFKYRPAVYDLPPQLTTDFNLALYAGWRHDRYRIVGKTDPLGRCRYRVINRGFDFGLFAGTGTTSIGPFSTQNATSNEYSGMILQFGLAGFIESNLASFGLSTGLDHLLSADRNTWVYEKRPWIGFVIGVALN